jgi:hypothetical protein
MVFMYSTFYLVRHWFDFFCSPWTLDNILLSQRVPYHVCIPIFGGALAWSRRYRRPANFWSACSLAVVFFANDFYYRYLGLDETLPFISTKSASASALMVYSAVFGDCKFEPESSSTDPADHSTEDTEAARDNKSTEAHVGSAQSSQTRTSSRMAHKIYDRLPNIRTASTLSFIAAVATMMMHPPILLQEQLSKLNCEAHVTKLDFDDQHFQFSATRKKTGMFASFCSEPQQLLVIERAMNEHVNGSDATCGVWCARRAVDGQVLGFISQTGFGLVDMYYCRGGYGSFGPDCEVEGEDYGYDVSREGWMNDIHKLWSVLEEDADVTSAADGEDVVEDSERQ